VFIFSFITKMKEIVLEQEMEVQRAVINRGKYKFREEYSFLQVEETKWFSMTVEQRKTQMKRVFSYTIDNTSKSKEEISFRTISHNSLSVSVEDGATLTNLRITNLDGIWNKATSLLQQENMIVPAPGNSPKARMVASYTSNLPHLVKPGVKTGSYTCDSNCPNWKSQSLCSHTVAVAELHGELKEFLLCRKKKGEPSVLRLVTCNMPKGRGNKGGVAPRNRRRTAHTEQIGDQRIPMMPTQSDGSESVQNTNTVNQLNSSASTSVPSNPSYSAPPYIPPPIPSPYPASTYVPSPNPSPSTPYPALPYIPPPNPSPSIPYPALPYIPPPNPSPSSPYPALPYVPPPNQSPYPVPPIPSASPYFPNRSSYYTPPEQQTIDEPFVLCFIKGNISVCVGCRNKYFKSPVSPNNLCVRHTEWREFKPKGSTEKQVKYGNVYYHCKVNCIRLRCQTFDPTQLDTSGIIEKLDDGHKHLLYVEFGLLI
jgi:hypothetical protein